MFLPLTVTLVSAPGLAVFLVARSSFFTWATAGIKPLNKRALNRIRFISDVVPFSREYTARRGVFEWKRRHLCPRPAVAALSCESGPGLRFVLNSRALLQEPVTKSPPK